MKVQISFKEINPEYDQKYANVYHFGKESDGNWKINYLSSFLVINTDEVKIADTGDLPCILSQENKEQEVILKNMTTFSCYRENQVIAQYSVSTLLIDKTHLIHNKKLDKAYFYFYLKPNGSKGRIAPNIYISQEQADLLGINSKF